MLEIRRMRTEDLDEVAALERAIFSQPWSKKGFEAALCQEAALYMTARIDGKLAGYCGLLQSGRSGHYQCSRGRRLPQSGGCRRDADGAYALRTQARYFEFYAGGSRKK